MHAKVEVSTLSADERRAAARRLILEAFAERPLIDVTPTKVIGGRDVAKDIALANGGASDDTEG